MAKAPKDDEKEDAAPAAEGAEGEVKPLDEEGGGGLNAKKLLMIVGPILILGVAAALYFMGVFGGKSEEGAEGEQAVAEGGAEGGAHGEGGAAPAAQFMEIPDLLVNLSTAGGPARFLKLKVKLEVSSPEDLARLQTVAPRVVDQFQTFLREMRVQDLRGSAGIYRLRQELLYRVNLAAQPVKVKDVLFQEILIQ
jgi:flagellar FliL protein